MKATLAMVALGSAGFVAFSGAVGQGDPARVAAQVVSGTPQGGSLSSAARMTDTSSSTGPRPEGRAPNRP